MYKNLRMGASAYIRITPKPEVEIMMRNKKELKGFLLTATRLIVLALVFVTAFTVALTSDVVVIDGSDTVANVANAAKTNANKGGCVPLLVSGFEADAFKFPTAGVWTITQSLARISISAADETGNVSVYKPEKTGVDVNISASGNQYVVQADGLATAYIQVTSRMCFDLGDFVNAAIQAGYVVKVTVDASVSFEGGSNRQNGALAVATLAKADTSEPRDAYATTVTLTKEKPYLVYESYSTAKNQTALTDPIKHTVTFNSIKVEISLSDGSTSDGAAPIVANSLPGLENSYIKGVSGSGYAPYVTDTNTASNFPVYFDSIKKFLKTDKVADGTGTLASYTNSAIDKINGKNYYKFAQTEYVDMFNRTDSTFDDLISQVAGGGTVDADTLSKIGAGDKVFSISGSSYSWNDPSATHFLNASGIKTVKVGDTVFDIYDSSGNAYGSQTKEVTISDTDGNVQSVGYATVTRTNRSRVVVSIYFTTNGTVQTEVTDYSGFSTTTRLEVTGIDTSLNDNGTPISDNEYMKADASSLVWLYSNILEVGSEFEIPEDTSAASYSPRLWFFSVQRADELAGLGSAHVFASIADLLASGLKPIGAGEGFTLDYNFADGKAKSYGSANYDAIGTLGTDGKVTSESGAKGHGYYLFTFYTIDLAGNMSAKTSSYYVKADFDTPNYNVDLSYILKTDGTKQTISASQNGTWAKGVTTLDIVLGALGFSGNTLVFEDLMSYHVFKFENAKVDGVYTSRLASYYNSLTSTGATAVENNETTITLSGEGGNHTVTVKYIFEASTNSGILRFVINADSIEWATAFTLYTGGFDTVDEMDFHQGHSYVDSTWVGGVKVLIDTDNPIAPEFVSGDDTPFSKNFDSYEALPSYSDRQWYTGAYDKYSASIDFTDVFLSSEYGKDVRVYYGIKVVQNLAGLVALGEKSIEGVYGTITDNSAGYFDRLQCLTGDNMAEGGTVLENGAMNIVNGVVGMRVIYVWAVDQAGNVSDLKTYYVLADNTTYTLSAKLGKNSVADASASIVSVDAEGNALTKFTRGEVATLNTVLGEDFVPFALTLTVNGKANKVLYNYMPSRDWTISDADNEEYINYAQNDSIKLAIDDKDNLGILDNTKTLNVEFAYRKVVDYTVTNSTVAYNSRPISVEMTFTDAVSASSFSYRYFDENGVELAQAPTNPGNYFVEIFIDKNNANYVTADFNMNGEGNQLFNRIAVTVTKGRIVISAVETSAPYGTDLANILKYTVSGIALEDMAKEGITEAMLALALDVANYDSKGFYAVGFYNVVLKDNALLNGVANYDIAFMTAQHRVTQRNIDVYTQAATKAYGDADPKFYFGVKESDLAFNTSKTAQDILAEIFDVTTYTAAGNKNGFYLYEAGDRITREKGELVWSYPFNTDKSLFDVGSNYRITLQTQEGFTITQRQVEIDVSGQFAVVKSGVTPSSEGIVPSYTLDAKDAFLAETIEGLLNGKLTLSADGTVLSDYDSAKYEGATGFNIVLASINDSNIAISLKSQEQYVIYIAKAGTVIVKAIKEFTYVYGETVPNTNTYNAKDFTYECDDESVVFDRIDWIMHLSYTGEYISVGRYVATFSDVKLYKDGVEIQGANVNVEPAIVNITPATVQIRPTATAFDKVYGEADSAYGIGYEIVKVNDVAFGKSDNYAGIDYNDLLASVSGSFARAKYNKNGEFTAYGTRYDGVLTNDNYYYGYVVSKAFAIDNDNFVANAAVDGEYKNARFTISPKAIVIHTAKLVGLSKYFNGNNVVDYDAAGVTMYDLTSQLALATDKVKLVANDMRYTEIGDGKSDVASHIVFGGFALTGEQCANYSLAYIANDGHSSVKVLGNKDGENFVIDGTTVEIVYIDNSYTDGAKNDNIYIMFKRVGITKNDVSIVKEYDNTNVLYADNVIIAMSETDHASTAMLRGANKTLIVEESGVFSGVNAGDGYLISRVKLVFTFANGDLTASSVYDYKDNDVDIRVVGNTIELTVRNVKATIAKKILNASSFATVAPVNRDYNSTTNVDVNYTFADNALVTGDSVESVGLKLVGTANGKDFGQHQVTISAENTKISNANYEVDVNHINNEFAGLTVEIAKARLIPNVAFGSKVYDNTTDVKATKRSGNDFTTLYYADNLREELAHITMGAGVTYALSYAGALDANVAVDADGNEIGHNVMVSGLVIGADDASILKNYRIYGSVYNGSEYMAFEDVQIGTIADYEILQAVKVSKKNVKLITNDFQIGQKVYDGSVNATITIQVPVDGGNREGVLAIHKDMLEIVADGTFASAKVGKNIKVIVSAPQLKLKSGNGIDNRIINNYYLDKSAGAYANNITGTIVEKPVTVEVDLGERVYTGYSDIVKNKITYTLNGVIENEIRNYNVATGGGAYFIDKNIVLDADRNVDFKDGNVYNPTLTNAGGFDINYVITYKTTVREDGRDSDMLAYEDKDGVHYYPQSVPATASAYYYRLRTVSKYVDDADKTVAKDYIVGRYKVNGEEVYLVSDDYTGTAKNLDAPMSYLTGKGKINQRGVYITANSITKLDTDVANKMYNKQYDGTTKFYGTVQGTNPATDAYRLTSTGIANVIKGDDVHVKNVSAEYNSAYTNAMYVVFTASGLDGTDADNYTIESSNSGASSDTYTAKLSAKIQKRAITASLKDGEMVYGTALGNVGGTVDYTLVGADNTSYALNWNASLKSFFVATTDFIAIVGLEDNQDNAKYFAQINAYTYNLVGGEYVKAENGARGEYFRLGGEAGNAISSLPKPTTRFNSNKPNAGEISNSYYLADGSANNFGFKFVYTGNGNDGTSRLVVVKRTLYVTTAGINHVKTYAGTDPAIDLLFEGIASGDGLNIFVDAHGVDYRPVVVLAVYNSLTGEYTKADKYAKTSDKLGANEYYVYYLALPSGLSSYDDFAPISNYNVVIGDASTLRATTVKDESGNVVKDANGKDTYEFVYSFASGEITKKASTVTIKLPEMDGISINTANNTFTYTYDKTERKGVNRVYDVLKGVKPEDEVRYIKDGEEKEARDAGTHTGYVYVKRFVKVDDNDPNGYFIEWRSTDEVTIVIEKASAQLKAAASYVYYDGKAQSYPVNSITVHEGIVNGLDAGDYEMSYKLYKNGQYEDVLNSAEIKNAGTYIVTFRLTDAFETNNPNYKKEEVESKFVINQVVVNVTIDKTGYSATTEVQQDKSSITKLRATYDPNADYTVNYTVAMGDGYRNNSAIEITKAMTKVTFAKDASGNEKLIKGAGKYSFTVSIASDDIAGNYALVGNAGVLELTANAFDSDGGSIKVDGEGIVANRFAVRDITNSIVASDINYVAVIKQFMPALSSAAGLKDDARVAAVVKMELYCDNQLVVPNGENTSVSVAIPSTVRKNMKGIALYTVTKDGTLKKLTDYTVNDGHIEYTTDYVSALVFVDVNPPSLEPWEIGVTVGTILVVLIIVVASVVGVIVRKKHLKKLI